MLLSLADSALPFAGDPTPFTGRAVVVAVVVVGVLAAVAWMLRRAVPSRRQRGAIAIETAAPLGERRSLVIVTVEGRRLLLGLTPTQVSLVAELGGPSFGKTLDAAIQPGSPS